MRLPLLAGSGAVAFMSVLYVIDPNQPGHYPACPWLLLTGTYCPGCGSMRATHDLLHGHLADALARNPFTVVTFIVMAFGYAGWVRRQWTGRVRTRMAPAWVLYALFAAIMAFWVLRNIPGWTWLSPA
jgi:hypothetical protein